MSLLRTHMLCIVHWNSIFIRYAILSQWRITFSTFSLRWYYWFTYMGKVVYYIHYQGLFSNHEVSVCHKSKVTHSVGKAALPQPPHPTSYSRRLCSVSLTHGVFKASLQGDFIWTRSLLNDKGLTAHIQAAWDSKDDDIHDPRTMVLRQERS